LRTENVTFSARGKGERLDALDWKVSGPADLVLSMMTDFPWDITGAMSAEGTFDLTTSKGALALEIASGDVQWNGGEAADWIAFDAAKLEIEHTRDEYLVRRLEVRRGNASVIGEGWVRPRGESGSPE